MYLQKLLYIINILLIFVISTSLSSLILLQKPNVLMMQKISTPKIEQSYPISKIEKIKLATTQSYDLAIKNLESPNPVLNLNERKHLKSVNKYFRLVPKILFFSISLYILYLTLYIKKIKKLSVSIFLLIDLILFTTVIFFQKYFIYLHEILFPQGNWTFPANSLLILSFNEKFWLYNWIELIIFCNIFFLILSLGQNFLTKSFAMQTWN